MSTRPATIVALPLALALGLAAAPVEAASRGHRHAPPHGSAHAAAAGPRAVDPARVLAGGSGGYAGRTANLTSIMGEAGAVIPMRIPMRPEHPRALHREADASAGQR